MSYLDPPLSRRASYTEFAVREDRLTRSTPSYSGLRPASTRSSYAKKRNRGTDTVPEMLLRRHVWQLGLRYRKNFRSLPGRPDIAFTRERVAVFCHGDFWHGHDWPNLRRKLAAGSNADYWVSKIRTNMVRDRRNRRTLEQEGWAVVELWEGDIRADPASAARKVAKAVRERRRKPG